MNFLAHAVLSFNDPEILVGNMISDFVKGRRQFDYPDGIRQGIMLHRFIDTFTDEHPVTREAKQVFRPAYRLYSGAFIDVVYDHFLALDPQEFSSESLFTFSQQVYEALDRHTQWLPTGFAGMLPYMKRDNWLFNYRTAGGIRHSFAGLVRRSAYLSDSATAGLLLDQHYEALRESYQAFWPELKAMAVDRLDDRP